MSRTRRLAVVGAVLLVAVALLASCSRHNDYYRRAPYSRGIDPALATAERQLAQQLTQGESSQILSDRTAPPWSARMRLFLRSYAGHPAAVFRMSPGDDSTAEERLEVSCPNGAMQQVRLAWAWFNGAWRAWPEYHLFPIHRCGAGPSMRAAGSPSATRLPPPQVPRSATTTRWSSTRQTAASPVAGPTTRWFITEVGKTAPGWGQARTVAITHAWFGSPNT